MDDNQGNEIKDIFLRIAVTGFCPDMKLKNYNVCINNILRIFVSLEKD